MLKLHTAPAGLAVSLEEAKLHCKVDIDEDDDLITDMIGSATEECEHLIGSAIVEQKWQLSLESFTNPIRLERPPVTAVDSITYQDNTGADVVLDPSDYVLTVSDFDAVIVPVYGTSFPSARAVPESVRVVFTTGFENVPKAIKSWIKLRVGALYENREAWTLGKAIERNDFLDGLLDRYRTWA